jgi:hypothetical protein
MLEAGERRDHLIRSVKLNINPKEEGNTEEEKRQRAACRVRRHTPAPSRGAILSHPCNKPDGVKSISRHARHSAAARQTRQETRLPTHPTAVCKGYPPVRPSTQQSLPSIPTYIRAARRVDSPRYFATAKSWRVSHPPQRAQVGTTYPGRRTIPDLPGSAYAHRSSHLTPNNIPLATSPHSITHVRAPTRFVWVWSGLAQGR